MAKPAKKKLTRSEIRQQRGRPELTRLLKRQRKNDKVPPAPAEGVVSSQPAVSPDVLNRLFAAVEAKADARNLLPAGHSARLLSRGVPQVAQKLGEEAVECVIALLGGDKLEIVGESADILYHLLVAWVAAGVRPADVWGELQRRETLSTLIEGSDPFSKATLRSAVGTSKIPF